jgi:flavin reductase (DIM6/NTAB) family NADH-FMN oxidoreductase RutF
MKAKVSLPLDKRAWHPSPLVGQIVLVTTLNADGTSNIAPKSWISMMAFDPPVLALGCNLQHWTGRNILERHEFVVNVPGVDMVELAWKSHAIPHPRPIEAAGLTPFPSQQVKPPSVEECRAHLECVLDQYLTYDQELIVLGRIVAGTVDAAMLAVNDPYAYLRTAVYLESQQYGVIEGARRLPRQA